MVTVRVSLSRSSFTPVTVTVWAVFQSLVVKVRLMVVAAAPPAATCTPAPAVMVTVTSFRGSALSATV